MNRVTTNQIASRFSCCLYGCKLRECVGGGTVLDRILDLVPPWVTSACDAFCGSAVVGLALKTVLGLRVWSFDARWEALLRASCLVGNNSTMLSGADMAAVCRPAGRGWFGSRLGLILGDRNAAFVDGLAANLHRLEDPLKRDLAVLGTLWPFEAHVNADPHLHVAWHRRTLTRGRNARDIDLAAGWRKFQTETLPGLLSDNGRENPCQQGDAVDLVRAADVHLLAADPPYCASWSSYAGSYALAEHWIAALSGEDPGDPFSRAPLPAHSMFSDPEGAMASFAALMRNSKHIPLWIVCWNDAPTNQLAPERIAHLAELLGRRVRIDRHRVRTRNHKRGVAFHNECLIVCQGGPSKKRLGGGRSWGGTAGAPRSLDVAPEGMPKALAMFAGCGGMTKGFEDAGWDVVAANEIDKHAAATHRLNFPNTQLIEGDITDPEVKAAVIEAARGCKLVFGGSPCKAYSTSGKRDPGDPCGRLYVDFLDVVEAALPPSVAIENIADITSMRRPEGIVSEVIERRLRWMGYEIHARILCAADWGVPQLRRRWILVAVQPGVEFRWPEPTHSEGGANGLPPWVTAREALADLEEEPEDGAWSHVFVRHRPNTAARILRTQPGQSANDWSESYRRLFADRPAWTVKACVAGLHVHYRLHRQVSPREAARLQGFSDDFRFLGAKKAVVSQVGNAVPPPLAEAVARAVASAVLGSQTWIEGMAA